MEWFAGRVQFRDILWADPVNMWRDWFEPELQRVLCPGGVVPLAFSNRWFPPKAVAIWSQLHEFERLGMVLEMFHQTPGFQDLSASSRRGLPRPDDDSDWDISYSDPAYMAWGRKSTDAD